MGKLTTQMHAIRREESKYHTKIMVKVTNFRVYLLKFITTRKFKNKHIAKVIQF